MISKENEKKNQISLIYWQIRGRAQSIRNLLCYLNIQYQQVTIKKNQQHIENDCEDSFFLTGLPRLQQNGHRLVQTTSIMRYLIIRQNRNDMLGFTPQNQAKINQILFKNMMENNKILNILKEYIKSVYQNPENSKQLSQTILRRIIQESKFTQACLIYLKKQSYWIMNTPTILDFYFYQICFYVVNILGSGLGENTYFTKFSKYKKFFESLDFYQRNKQLLESKPVFYEFQDKNIIQTLTTIWAGDKSKLFC